MTDRIKVALLMITAVLVIGVLLIGTALQVSANKDNEKLKQIYLRKEDLLSQQQKLKLMLDQLNQTLQQEIEKNSELSTDLTQVKQATPVVQQPASPVVNPTPAAPKAPVRKVRRVVRRVTRAS